MSLCPYCGCPAASGPARVCGNCDPWRGFASEIRHSAVRQFQASTDRGELMGFRPPSSAVSLGRPRNARWR